MAFSKAKACDDQLIGGLKMQIFNLNFAGVTSGDIQTGLYHIFYAGFNNQTSEAQGLVTPNVDSDGVTVKNGAVHISGVVASDLGQLIVIGH